MSAPPLSQPPRRERSRSCTAETSVLVICVMRSAASVTDAVRVVDESGLDAYPAGAVPVRVGDERGTGGVQAGVGAARAPAAGAAWAPVAG